MTSGWTDCGVRGQRPPWVTAHTAAGGYTPVSTHRTPGWTASMNVRRDNIHCHVQGLTFFGTMPQANKTD